jgi:hypothetical protein
MREDKDPANSWAQRACGGGDTGWERAEHRSFLGRWFHSHHKE